MSEHAHETDDAHHGEHGIAQYIYVFLGLCVLTSASFLTTQPWWPLDRHSSWAFMMAVSCTKAMLVILFFMHLKYEASWKYVLTIPAGFMSIFLILALVPDVGLRGMWASEERRQNMGEPRETHTAPRHVDPDSKHDKESHPGGEKH